MSDAFIGEIRAFPYMFAPQGWFDCDGRQLLVAQYQALAVIVGTIYGGDGRTYFNIPNLQGLTAVGVGPTSPYNLGKHGGSQSVALTAPQIPVHDHNFMEDFEKYSKAPTAFTNAPQTTTVNKVTTGTSYPSRYLQPTSATAVNSFDAYVSTMPTPTPLASASLAPYTGGGGAHENRQPYTVLRYCICWDGIFPTPPG